MDSVGGHAAGADKPGVGSSGADIPGVQASCAVRQQLQGGPGQSEFAFLLGAATQHLAFATGEVAGLRYADGALDVEMAPARAVTRRRKGARQTGSRRRQGRRIRRAAGGCAARAAAGRGTREPLMSLRSGPWRRRRSRQGASASRTGARAPGIIGSD